MPLCPKCKTQEMVAHDGKMVCNCGYQYSLLKRVPTYKELIDFVCDYEMENTLLAWLEVKDGL